MIRILAGEGIYSDGRNRRVITPDDGPVRLPRHVEQKWVDQGVAAYVDEPSEEPIAAPEEELDEDAEDYYGDEGEAPDYEDMTIAELRAECEARGIGVRKRERKDELVARLRADDEPPAFDALEAE